MDKYYYDICDFENPAGLTLDTAQMKKKAKQILKFNRFQGLDKGVTQKDLDSPINAWVYLKNCGIGKETNRKIW